MKFSIKDFFSKCDQEEILNGKLDFVCSDTKFNYFTSEDELNKILQKC